MIYFDPTESRNGTRLPASVIDAGKQFANLEALTGADLLLTPLLLPLTENTLKRHCEAGLLIQRKTGRDAVSSIPKYAEILFRMQQWSQRCYLVTVGFYGYNREGKVICEKQELDWNWMSFNSALEWWKLRGGYVTNLPRDGALLGWLNSMLEILHKVGEHPDYTIVTRQPAQVLHQSESWIDTLSTFPGIGSEKALALGQRFGSLAECLCWLSDGVEEPKVEGIGTGIRKAAHNYLGLAELDYLNISTAHECEDE